MKAFVGHSFADKDEALINKIIVFLLQELDIKSTSGERPENNSISKKIKDRIKNNDLFIGIFTRDQEIVQPEGVGEKKYTTSNWVLQESGYAIGKNKDIILMVEEGIPNLPGLQGDQELIYFDRGDLSKGLLKLSAVISDVRAKVNVDAIGRAETAKVKPTEDKEDTVDEPELQESEPLSEMLNAYYTKDLPTAEKFYTEKVKGSLDSKEVKLWDAIILRWKYQSGDVKALRELEERAKEEENYDVLFQLALCYEFADNEALVTTFSACAKLANDDNDLKVRCNIKIAKYYAKNKQYDLAIETLLELTRNPSLKDQLEQIFLALLDIAEKEENVEHYILFAEKVLDVNPVNTYVRFNLAFKYGDTNKNDLAIYHYKKLLECEDNTAGLNNIAIAYSILDMKAKAVSYYKKSIEEKGTLASANLANKYLNEGFTDLAEKVLVEADKLSQEGISVHENIGNSKNRLKKMLEEEENKEKDILNEAQKMPAFKIRYANAYCKEPIVDIANKLSGKWSVQGKWNIPISFNNETNEFEGSCKEEVPDFVASLVAARTGLSLGEKTTKTRRIEVKGTIKNLSGKYSIKIIDESKPSLGGLAEPSLVQGTMIVNDEFRTIDTFEEDNTNNRLYSKWTKVS